MRHGQRPLTPAHPASGSPLGYHVPQVEAWLATHVPQLQAPLAWTRLEGGHSNLTYQLTDASGRKAVIRRPAAGRAVAQGP